MRIRLQLDAGLLMLMSLVAVVMPNAEDDGAQQHPAMKRTSCLRPSRLVLQSLKTSGSRA